MSYTVTCFKDIIHLLYPVICAGCGSDLISGKKVICDDCENGMPVTGFHFYRENPVEKIFRGRLPVITASAHAYFSKDSVVQNILHSLKYGGNKEVGIKMGRMMGRTLKTCEWNNNVFGLVPLPLHFSKQKKRGYNQAKMICDGISAEMNIPVLTDVIERRKNTSTQTRKSRIERWTNIESKFELKNQAVIMNKHVLLVDDVITTGATLEACGSELLKIEGLQLSIAAFAYTLL
jgi:ComF family protein